MQRLSTVRYCWNTSSLGSRWLVTDFSVAAVTYLAKPLTSDGRISWFQYSGFRQHVTLLFLLLYFKHSNDIYLYRTVTQVPCAEFENSRTCHHECLPTPLILSRPRPLCTTSRLVLHNLTLLYLQRSRIVIRSESKCLLPPCSVILKDGSL
jgi:hypothetical protein